MGLFCFSFFHYFTYSISGLIFLTAKYGLVKFTTTLRIQLNQMKEVKLNCITVDFHLLKDMIQSITVIKLYVWETAFMKTIEEYREKEILVLKRLSSIRGLNEAIFFSSSSIISAIGFTVFWAFGGDLTPSIVFTTSSYIQIARLTMTNLFFKAFQLKSEVTTAINRIERLFLTRITNSPLHFLGIHRGLLITPLNDANVMIYMK